MIDYADLVARLRAASDDKTRHDHGVGDFWNLCEEAADAIERLSGKAEPVAWLFTVREEVGGRKAAVTFAAIDWSPSPDDPRTLVRKEPLFLHPTAPAPDDATDVYGGDAINPAAPAPEPFHWNYSCHYTAENIAAIVQDLRAVEDGRESPQWRDRDHRTRAGILWRVILALSHEVPTAAPAAPAPDALDAARYRFLKTLDGQVLFIQIIRNKGADFLDAAVDEDMKDQP